MKRAFTLIELLIVVAIIAILAAIAVPNFLEAQVRSKVSRAKSDIRSLATAIEAYRVDFNREPSPGYPGTSWKTTQVNGEYPFAASVENRAYSLPCTITTPVAYITAVPVDAFGGETANDDLYKSMGDVYPLYYWYFTKRVFGLYNYTWQVSANIRSTDYTQRLNDGSASWVILSKGPDKYWAKIDAREVDAPQAFQYDSSNGTVSVGNIFRCD